MGEDWKWVADKALDKLDAERARADSLATEVERLKGELAQLQQENGWTEHVVVEWWAQEPDGGIRLSARPPAPYRTVEDFMVAAGRYCTSKAEIVTVERRYWATETVATERTRTALSPSTDDQEGDHG